MPAVDDERLADDVAHLHAGIERGIGILEDHLGLGTKRLQLPGLQRGDLAAVQPDAAAGRFDQAQDHLPERRLAGPGLTDQTERLPSVDLEIDVVDRAHDVLAAGEQPFALREVLGQSLGAQEDVVQRGASS